jgi:serine/threonine protein kinase
VYYPGPGSGLGSVGLVFLAPDLKYYREVAVKILRPDVASGVGAARFLREIQSAARLPILPSFRFTIRTRPTAWFYYHSSDCSPWSMFRRVSTSAAVRALYLD